MNLQLTGKIALVTGASRGIGKAIAIALASEKAKVIICARHREQLIKVQRSIEKSGGDCTVMITDVTDPKDVQKTIDLVAAKYRKLDILINNAGGAGTFSGFENLTLDDWLQSYLLNVGSIVNFVKSATSLLCKSKSGRIISISSLSAVQPGLYNPHYTASKAAVINVSKYLSNHFAHKKILVNTVCVGPVHTESWDDFSRHLAEVKKLPFKTVRAQMDLDEINKIPLKVIGEADDVAHMVLFLCSDKAQWITGSCFHVNGGKLRTIS